MFIGFVVCSFVGCEEGFGGCTDVGRVEGCDICKVGEATTEGVNNGVIGQVWF